jgi:hypothetical protein
MTSSQDKDQQPTKLERAIAIKNEHMKEGVHYGKVVDNQSDFLYLTGASLLADAFSIDAIMGKVEEENVAGQHQITVTMNMVHNDKTICVGLGTWDSGEMLGTMKGARQRGIAMAYKRAYVMGIRYATSSHGLFSQDKDVVDVTDEQSPASAPKQYNNKPKEPTVDQETGEITPAAMYRDIDGDLRFSQFGGRAKDKTVAEVLGDRTPDERSGLPRGASYLQWIMTLDDVSPECKNEITRAIEDNALGESQQ